MRFFKLRTFRIAVFATVVFGIILAASFAGGLWVYRQQELDSSSRHLDRSANRVLSTIKKNPSNPDFQKLRDRSPNLSFAVYKLDGSLLYKAGAINLTNTDGRTGLRSTPNGEEIHSVATDNTIGTVYAAVNWDDHEASMRRIALDLVLLLLPLVLAGGCLTYFAARKTFNPLDKLARQAEELSATDRSARLKVEHQDEFGAFANRLNRFLGRLQASVDAQEQFVTDAAHELRTPLTVIRGQIETTLLRPRPVEEYQQSLQTVLEEAERLSNLSDLLLLSAGPVDEDIDPISVEDAVQEVESRWVDRYADNGITLNTTTEMVLVKILPEEMTSILDNLLSNALRYSPKNSSVTLTLAEKSGKAVFDCTDEGPGVPKEMLDRVFERFTRGDSGRSRAYGGFGIGLSVCKRLAEARGGSIRALESEHGAHFQVVLPAVSG